MQSPETPESFSEKFEELDRRGSNTEGAVAQQRGHDFESLLLDLFDHSGILLRSSFHTSDNRREQIDGAILLDGRIALVEAKWTKDVLAASELYSFLGKVEGKFAGTIGIFVSRNELSPNFLHSLKAGRRQSVIVIHGDDVPPLFKSDFPLLEYLRESIYHVSIDNKPNLPVQDFLKGQGLKRQHAVPGLSSEDQSLIENLSQPNAKEQIGALVAATPSDKLEASALNLLQELPRIALRGPSAVTLSRNVASYIISAVQHFRPQEARIDRYIFGVLLPGVASSSDYLHILEAFAPRLEYASKEVRDSVGTSLRNAWKNALGDFEEEKRLAGSTQALFPYVADQDKEVMLKMFISILNSYPRRPGYPQYALATKIVEDPANCQLVAATLEGELREEFQRLREEFEGDSSDAPRWAWRIVRSSYSKLCHNAPNAGRIIESLKSLVTEYSD